MRAEIISDKIVVFPQTPTEIYAVERFLDSNGWCSTKDILTIDTKEYLDAED